MSFETTRRDFLRGALAAGALIAASRARALALSPQRHFAPVKVARDRIIREVVGLRPFRAEGFVVDAQRVGNKLLIHNYGHGGGGMTLSWGTAYLAVEKAAETGQTDFAVLGCGGVGLATARLLQRRGFAANY